MSDDGKPRMLVYRDQGKTIVRLVENREAGFSIIRERGWDIRRATIFEMNSEVVISNEMLKGMDLPPKPSEN